MASKPPHLVTLFRKVSVGVVGKKPVSYQGTHPHATCLHREEVAAFSEKRMMHKPAEFVLVVTWVPPFLRTLALIYKSQ